MQVAELYRDAVKPLPVADRLRLATLILNDITSGPPPWEMEGWSDEWTEDDLREFTAASWSRGWDESDDEEYPAG